MQPSEGLGWTAVNASRATVERQVRCHALGQTRQQLELVLVDMDLASHGLGDGDQDGFASEHVALDVDLLVVWPTRDQLHDLLDGACLRREAPERRREGRIHVDLVDRRCSIIICCCCCCEQSTGMESSFLDPYICIQQRLHAQ